jgi:hypothetical protein
MLGLGLWWWIANSDLMENRSYVSPHAMAMGDIESSKTSLGVLSWSNPRKLWIPESCAVYMEQPRLCTLILTLFKFRGRRRDQSPDMIRKTEPDTVDDVWNWQTKKHSRGRDLIIKQFFHLSMALVVTCSLVGEQICSKKMVDDKNLTAFIIRYRIVLSLYPASA